MQFLASKSLRVWQNHSAFSEENWLPDCYVLACFTQCLLKEAARLFKIAQFVASKFLELSDWSARSV